MEIQIDNDVQRQIQSLTNIRLQEQDYYFFIDWLLPVGVATVKAALKAHPELLLGDLVMMRFRKDAH